MEDFPENQGRTFQARRKAVTLTLVLLLIHSSDDYRTVRCTGPTGICRQTTMVFELAAFVQDLHWKLREASSERLAFKGVKFSTLTCICCSALSSVLLSLSLKVFSCESNFSCVPLSHSLTSSSKER